MSNTKVSLIFSKYHKMWYYMMCTTSTTNTTKCGAVNRVVLIGMKKKTRLKSFSI